MYVKYFKLSALPFSLNPDPLFVYRSRGHARAEGFVKSESAPPDACLAVIGEAGVGKTLLLQTLLDTCPAHVLAAQVNYPLETIGEFLQAALSQLNVPHATADARELLRAFDDFLSRCHADGRRVLLVVDEAHDFSGPVLASILQLAERSTSESGDLRVVIAGEPALDELLAADARDRHQPQQCAKIQLSALPRSAMELYILHRLEVAGARERGIFRPDVFETIFRFTGGNPRRINMLCHAAMTIAVTRNSGSVALAEVRQAIEELHWTAEPMPADGAPAGRVGNGAPAPARLYVLYRGKAIAHLELTCGRANIGRADDNDLRIASEFISRHHCQVLTKADRSMIKDVSSTNGLYLNERRVRRHWLRDGDILRIGDHELRYADRRNRNPACETSADQDSPAT